MSISQSELTGIRVFCCAGSGTAERVLQPFQETRGSIIALVGAIPMVPGSTAAKGLTNLFALLQAGPGEEIAAATNGMRNLLEVTLTLAAIGTALAIPQLTYPKKKLRPKPRLYTKGNFVPSW
jgi:uncharacterized membrane protein YjjB (DUF3815 family)